MIPINCEIPCRLCNEILSFSESLFQEIYCANLKQNCFFESKNFQAMIPIGPINRGHLIVATKKHYVSMACLDRSKIYELYSIIQAISDFYLDRYKSKKILYFEHGPALNSVGACCLDHAHINILPLMSSHSIISRINSDDSRLFFERSSLHDLNRFSDGVMPYLFFIVVLKVLFQPSP